MKNRYGQTGLYVHVPFCIKKCGYCDFYSIGKTKNVDMGQMQKKYLLTLEKEINIKRNIVGDILPDTVFVGGGTPSFLSEKNLTYLFNIVDSNYNIKKCKEYTVECNPGTLNKEKLAVMKEYKVSRLSIGLQAWQDKLLQKIGRYHSQQDFLQSYALAREAGFENINTDIMFGLPGQTTDDFNETLENIIDLKPEHISCYSLILEEGTKLFKIYGRYPDIFPDDESERKMYHSALESLQKAGYKHYEISNFAKPGYECKHNLIYWHYENFIGLGPSAHSLINGTRIENEPDLEKYITDIKNSCLKSQLNETEQIEEYMIMGLRLLDGINKQDFKKRFDRELNEIYENQINKLIKKDLLSEDPFCIKLGKLGLDFGNEAFREFLL